MALTAEMFSMFISSISSALLVIVPAGLGVAVILFVLRTTTTTFKGVINEPSFKSPSDMKKSFAKLEKALQEFDKEKAEFDKSVKEFDDLYAKYDELARKNGFRK